MQDSGVDTGTLNDKQVKFCQEYVIDFNATQAAIRAGYSPDTASSKGSQLLNIVKVEKYITELQADFATAAQITREKLLRAYSALAFFDARKFYDDDGNLIPIKDLDEQTAFAIAGFDVLELKSEMGTSAMIKKIKMADRRAALDSIAKLLGLNAPEKRELTGANGAPLAITGEHKVTFNNFASTKPIEEPGT